MDGWFNGWMLDGRMDDGWMDRYAKRKLTSKC